MKTYKGKRIYYVGGSKSGFICSIVCAAFFQVMIVPFVIIAIKSQDSVITLLMIFLTLFFIVCIAGLILCSIFSYKGYRKSLWVKNGTKSEGMVERFIFVGGKAPYYSIIYSYMDEKNIMQYGRSVLSLQIGGNMLSRTKVPIYIREEYSTLDTDAIKALSPCYNYEKNTMKTCPHCGITLDGKKRYCKNCKNSI